uniref:Uncharacterized protein n=1 Tax=Anguilla anguilla TaxID=7936 RepID=A0A0E9Q3S4_ANGAN
MPPVDVTGMHGRIKLQLLPGSLALLIES